MEVCPVPALQSPQVNQRGNAMRVSRSVQWGSLTGMRKVETPEQMTEEYRATLIKIVHARASTGFAPGGAAPALDQPGAAGRRPHNRGADGGGRGPPWLNRLPQYPPLRPGGRG